MAALVAMVMGQLLLVGPLPAGAQVVGDDPFDCGADIVDEAGVLDADEILRAAQGVEATIIVRSFLTVPGGELIAIVDEITGLCFADEDGSVRANLAFFSFATENRTSDVFLGPALPGGAIPQDLADTMTARFPDGDFTGGVVDAIGELDQRLGDADADADPDPAADDGSGDSDSSDTGSGVASDDIDGGGLAAGVAAGAAAVVGAGAGGWVLVRRRRRRAAQRAALQSAVAQPRIRLGAVREQAQRLEGQAELWVRTVSGRTVEVWQEIRHRVRTASSETERAAALLSQTTPDGIEKASTEQLAKATDRLTELVEALDRNERSLDGLSAFGARLDHLLVALPAKRDLLVSELDHSESLMAERRQEGWIVDGQSTDLQAVASMLQTIDLNDFALDLLTLSEQLEAAEARLFAAHHDLQSLPDRPAGVGQWREKQVAAAELEWRRVEAGRGLLVELAQHHSTDSWQWTSEFPEIAGRHLARSRELGEQANAASERQAFDEAGRILEQAGLQLIAADDLLDQLEDLAVDLRLAKEEAAGIVAESSRVADEFGSFVERHRGDLDNQMRQRPGLVDEAIVALQADLTIPRPNFLRVAQTADRLNRELDDLLAAAVDQHQQMEALRRQAAREVARAQRSIERARQSLGWQLFPSSEARQLDDVAHRLGRLPADPGQRVEAARAIADDAVDIQERIIARRRRDNNWVIVGGSTGGSGSARSSSGRSRSFGGGGSAGRSFGGGRGRGSW